MLRRVRPTLAALALLASLPADAANLAPELRAPLPALVLEQGASAVPIDLAARFHDPDVPGPAARVTVRIGAETRHLDLALLPDAAPQTVANFLAYLDAGRYAANFFHRSVPGFIIQNGGFFFLDDTTFDAVPTFAPVVNEPALSNVRGTVAMAKLGGDPDSATSQWFINLADNSANLDAQNGGFTVFARVLGDGMQVADQIAALPAYDASDVASAWTDLPLAAPYLAREYFVETDIARIAPLSFTVAVDDPALVSATLDTQGRLSLAAAADRDGATTVRLTATDLEGAALEAGFTVTVRKPQSITFPPTDSLRTGDTFDPRATASSGLPVSYTVVSGSATVFVHHIDDDPTPHPRIRITGPGDFVIRASQAGDPSFAPAADQERTFTAAPPYPGATITLASVVHDYDRQTPPLHADTEPPGLHVNYTYRLGSAAPVGGIPVDAGRYIVTATIDDPRTLSTASARSTLVIRKRPLQVRARDARRPVGRPDPVFELEYSGFPGGVPEPIDRPPRAFTRATARSPQGEYPILLSGGLDNNFTFVPSRPPGRLVVEGAAGTYEALIGPPESPVGKLVITFPRNALAFTGVLTLARESRPVAIKSSTPAAFDEGLLTASATWSRAASGTTPALSLQFTATLFEGVLRIGDQDHPFVGEAVGGSEEDVGLAICSPHTLSLAPPATDPAADSPSPAPAPVPEGYGYATGKIDARARLSLTGRLADGAPFTYSGLPDSALAYRVWSSPYPSRAESYLAGLLGPATGTLAWKKAPPPPGAKKPDASYRAGFGPLLVVGQLREWNPYLAPGDFYATLSETIGLTHDESTGAAPFAFEVIPPSEGAFSEAQLAAIPPLLGFSRATKTLVPAPNAARLSLGVNPKTGAFSGAFRLTDTIPAPTKRNPDATRVVTRKVRFSGVLHQNAFSAPLPEFGRGHFLLPALPGAGSTEANSGAIRLIAP